MSATAVPADGLIRRETFALGSGAAGVAVPRVQVHVGADPVTIELVEGLDELVVEVRPLPVAPGSGAYDRLLQTLRGAALGSEAGSADALASMLLSSSEIAYSSFDDELVVRAPQRGAVRLGSVEISLRVPAGADLAVRGDVVVIATSGRAGELRLRGRRVQARLDALGSAELRCRQGRVAIDTVEGALRADLRAADLSVDDAGGDVDITSTSGAVALGLRSGGPADVTVRSDGALDLSGLPPLDGAPTGHDADADARQVSVQSASGEIRLERRAPREPIAAIDPPAAEGA